MPRERAATHGSFADALRQIAKRDGVDQLVHRAKQVEQTLESPGWKFLAELIHDREERVLEQLIPLGLSDTVLSNEGHVRGLALIAGLRQAREAPQTVLHIAEDEQRKRKPSGDGGEG